MQTWINFLGRFLLGIIGIVLISCVPIVLFQVGSLFDFSFYLQTILEVSKSLFLPSEWHLSYLVIQTMEIVPISLKEYLKGPYLYSMTILIVSLLFSLFIAFILAIFTTISNGPVQKIFLSFANILTAVPDFAYIFLIQLAVVQLYTMTGLRVLSFYSLGGERIYAAPIICLSVIPVLLFYKLLLLLFKQELNQPYVVLARSKGLSNLEVLLKHCTSNVMQSVFFQSKSIVWLTLSSLFIVEYLFGIEGILHYLTNDFSPKGISFILLSIFIPFFLFYSVVENLVKRGRQEKSAMFEGLQVPLLDRLQGKAIFRYKRKAHIRSFNIFSRQRLNITIPALIIVGLFSVSIAYYVIFHDYVEQVNFLYDSNGKLIGRPPLPPSSSIIFGTDPYGYSIFQQLLVGTKYTIIITLVIASIRVGGGYLLGIVYAFFLNERWRKVINSIADGMHFLPLTLLMFILLLPILIATGGFEMSLGERLFIQVVVMSVLVLPITTSLIGNEMNEAIKKEYVQSSAIMGGSLIWIILKHINPQIGRKLWLYWAQHVVQVLQTLVHLGVLSIFVGGAISFPDSARLSPVIYELSGMISIAKEVFLTKQLWLILPPLAIFMLLIFCFQKIAEGFTEKEMQLGMQKKRREFKWLYIIRKMANKTNK